MGIRERISANEKYEVLSTLSPGPIIVISGLLGGLIVALLLSPLIPWVRGVEGKEMTEEVLKLLVILGLLGAIAAKLLQWEYKVNREAYKKSSEFHIPIVYPFFFIYILGTFASRWLKDVSEIVGLSVWGTILVLVIGSALLSPALGVAWKFWHVLWLSILSPLDWRSVIDARNIDYKLKLSFAEVKRYPSPLSLTVMDIDQFGHIGNRAVRRIQEELINIIDKNIRETDAAGRIEGGRVVVALAHTGGSGASVQSKRVKGVLEEHLKSRRATKEKMTLSIGIASYAPDMASHQDLVEKAQRALQRAKEEGGNRIVVG